MRVLLSLFFIVTAAAVFASAGQQYYEQGTEAFKSGNFKNAELLFRKTIDADDEYLDRAWFYLSQSLYHQKRYKDALFEYNRFLLNCRTPGLAADSRFWIAECYNALNDYTKSIEEYKRFISEKNDKDDPYISAAGERIGDIYFRQRRFDEAVIEWKTALDAVQKNNDMRNSLNIKIAKAYFESGKLDDSEAILNQTSLDKNPGVQSESFLYLGRINQARVKHRIAIRFFSRIADTLRSVTPYSNALYFSALSYIELNEKENAKTALQTFISVASDSPFFLNAKYQYALLTQSQNPSDSVRTYDEIIKTTDDKELKILAAIEMARIYLSQGKAELAIPILEKISASDESDKSKQVSYDLGSAYLSVNNLNDAERIFTDMLRKYSFDQDADRIQFLLAVVQLKKGNSKLASDGFQKIRDINPFSKYINESKFYLASAQFDQGAFKNAIKYCEEYISTPNPEKRFDANVLILRSDIRLNDAKNAERNAIVLMKKFSDRLGIERIILEYCKYEITSGRENKQAESFILKSFPDSDSLAELYSFKGNYYFEKSEWLKADAQYTAFLKIRGNDANPNIFLRKVLCLYYQENYAGVIAFLNGEKITNYNKDIIQQIVLILARSYSMTGQYEKTYESFSALKGVKLDDQDNFMYFESALKNDYLVQAKSITAKLEGKKDYLSRINFVYGVYYRDIYKYDVSRAYFTQIVDGNSEPGISELAVLELAGLDYREGKFDDLIGKMKLVHSRSNEPKKNFLLVSTYIRLGKTAEAADILKKNGDMILSKEEGRSVARDLVAQLEDEGDIKELLAVGKILSSKYPAESDYINYYAGNYYFKTRVYDQALKFFLKIPSSNREYRTEVYYKIGLIYELNLKNVRTASVYFLQVLDSKDYDEFVALSKLEMAVIYFERGQKEASKKQLEDILSRKENIGAKLKAQNLQNYYGFEKEKK
jgi:tetratricopeptide (TPR) repeat protein